MNPDTPALRPHMLKSFVIHSLLILVICIALYRASTSIQIQEEAFLEDLKTQEEELAEAEKEAAEEMMEEELAQQVREEFEAVIEQELDEESAEILQDALEEQLDNWIEEAVEDQPLHEMSPEELAALSQELREMTMAELQKQLDEMKKDMLLAMVREKIKKEVAPDIRKNIEEELKNHTGKKLKESLEKQAKKENKERLQEVRKELEASRKEIAKLSKQQQRVMQQAKQDKTKEASVEQKAIEEKLAEVHKDITTSLAKLDVIAQKEIKSDVVHARLNEAKKEVAESEASLEQEDKNKQQKESADVAKKLNEATRAIDAVTKQIKQQEKTRTLNDIDKQAIAEILPEVEEALRKEVTAAVTEQSVPAAAKKLTDVLEKQLSKLQLNTDEFKKVLEKEITDALQEDMSKNKPQSETVTLKSKEMADRRSAEDIAEARKDIQKALSQLEKVNEKQRDLKENTIRETAAKDSQDELEIRDEITSAQQDAQKAVDKANVASLKMSRQLKSAREKLVTQTAVVKAKEASTYVKQEIVDEAKKAMQAVNDDLAKKINTLKEMDKGLEKEQHALEDVEAVAKDLKELLGEERAAELKEKMTQAATDPSVLQLAQVDVKKATDKTKMDDTLEGFDMLESLQELGDVMEAADGRMMDDAGELLGEMEAGLLGPGSGTMPPGPSGGSGMRFGGKRGYGYFNRKLYEEFSKDMRDRLNPKKSYEEQEENEGLHSHAAQRQEDVAATMVILKGQNSTAEDLSQKEKDKDRNVPEPTFHTIIFGAADYAIDPITIDGDLKDWGELRHPQKHRFEAKGQAVAEDQAVDVYVRWSPKGLYLCYIVKTTAPINNNAGNMWADTGMELFIDVRNRRKESMFRSPTAQQIFFCPFGSGGNPKITFGEAGRGFRGLKMLTQYPDALGLRGRSQGKLIPGGYQVECFIKRSSLAHPMLAPGMYVALNHSVNLGNSRETQWSAPKSAQTWNRPDTWGDVLLLGSDARVAFKHHEKHDQKLQGILPGDPVYVEITDPDMNLYEIKKDRIMATIKVKGSERPVMLVLKETKANSGVFAGSFATQAYFKKARANTLNIRGGDNLVLSYTDARSGYGEKNRKIEATLAVGWAVTTLGK